MGTTSALLRNREVEGFLLTVTELHGQVEFIFKVGACSHVFGTGVVAPTIHVTQAEGGQFPSYHIYLLILIVYLLLHAHGEVDHTRTITGVTRIDIGAAGKGRNGSIARYTHYATIVVMEYHLHQVDIHQRRQTGVDALHPHLLFLVEVIVILRIT